MWILFALTSAIILASRKIQEKQLVWDIWNSLGWMIRLGSFSWALLLWIIFSRELTGLDNPVLWKVLAYCFIAYPVMTFLYYRAMNHLPLSIFGMLAPVAPVTALISSWIWLDAHMSLAGIVWIGAISIAIIALFYKNTHADIKIRYLIYAVISFMIMWLGGMIDKIALGHTDPYTYAVVNQFTGAITLFITSYFLFGWPKVELFVKNIKTIGAIGVLQWFGWLSWMFAISQVTNPWYAVALINTHAILTALYGVFILKEEVTPRKVFVFICMLVALISFAFA